MPSPGAVATAPTQWLTGLSLEEGKNLCQRGHRPLLPLHLRQCRLCLGQPEGHVHSTIHLDSCRQCGTGWLSLAHPAIQCAKTLVAVGLEWAHAQFFS